ncbi:hypothetical protein FSP39_018229 [Pinctada imbricata]|uniref:Uncharacterized protein n=1 Tax=Pinctada imbricata TaxID=66713 RepID=A0AA88YN96_PINIB|nr:hypothetical protein FSP39_018229 [Pinctada imbricata]
MSKNRFFAVDIEEEIERYAWRKFKDAYKVRGLFRRKKNYYIDIQWGYAEFTHETTRFVERPDRIHGVPTEALQAAPKKEEEEAEKDVPKIKKGCKEVPLYTSEFENKTQKDQQYSFNTSRETTASASVEFQECYTKGAECNIEIGVKDIMTVGAGLSGELSVTKTEGQTFEEKLNWEVDTQIIVEAGHKAEATVKVSEKTATYDFEVKTTVSIIGGKQLPVVLRRRSDDRIAFFIPISDFRSVFYQLANVKSEMVQLEEVKHPGDDQEKSDLILITHGTCKNVSWLNQQVEVESKKIEGFVVERRDDDKDKADGGSS